MAFQQRRDDSILTNLVQGAGGTAGRQQEKFDDALLAGAMQKPPGQSTVRRQQENDDLLLAGVMQTPTNLKRQEQHSQDDAILSGIIRPNATHQAKRDDAALNMLQQGPAADSQQRRDDAALLGVLQPSATADQSKLTNMDHSDDAVVNVLQEALAPGKQRNQQSRDDAVLANVLGKNDTTILSKDATMLSKDATMLSEGVKDRSMQRQDDDALAGILGKPKPKSMQRQGDDTALADIMAVAAKSAATELTPQLKAPWVPLLIADSLNHYMLGWPRQVAARAVAGGYGKGNALHQLKRPLGIAVDGNDAVYIADNGNRRVVKWERDASHGEVLAAGRGGTWFDPLGVVLAGSGSFLVTVSGGVELWRHGAAKGYVVASGNWPAGIALDFDGEALLFADMLDHCVYRWPSLSPQGGIAAGGYGPGGQLHQLRRPFGVALDLLGSAILVADSANHRVVRWTPGSRQGEVVAGGRGAGDRLDQLNCPRGVVLDRNGDLLVADTLNHRVVRWRRGARRGEVIAGGAGQGYHRNQLDHPNSIAIDSTGGLLIADSGNHRVMRWAIAG